MMKRLQSTLFALVALAASGWAHAGDFFSDYDTAKKKAQEENKPLLVKFTGSDWCPPCKKLDAGVFSKDAFKTAVEKDFVVAVLDFPRKKELPEGQLKKNEAVRDEFGIRGYPTVLLIDQKGKVFKKMVGYGYTPEEGADKEAEVNAYLEGLKAALKSKSFL